MAYDIFTGPTFDNSEHGLTLDDATFEDFVAEHRCATPPYRLVSRVNDAYGDADFAAAEVRGLADELLELGQRATRRGIDGVPLHGPRRSVQERCRACGWSQFSAGTKRSQSRKAR